MALNAYAALTLNGTALDGDTSVNQIGGVDVSQGHIEVFEVRWGASVPMASSAGRLGRAELAPVVLSKPIDQTTPLLYQGLFTNMLVEGDVKLFESDPNSALVHHRFTLAISKARIQAIDSRSPDTHDPGTAAHPSLEMVTIVAGSMTWRDEVNGVEYSHSAAPR